MFQNSIQSIGGIGGAGCSGMSRMSRYGNGIGQGMMPGCQNGIGQNAMSGCQNGIGQNAMSGCENGIGQGMRPGMGNKMGMKQEIMQGVQDGSITQDELQSLMERRAEKQEMKQNFMSDGQMTHEEKMQMRNYCMQTKQMIDQLKQG